SVRLPNSMAMWTGEWPGAEVGIMLSGVHLGQVEQPRPDLVSRTAPPVTMIPALTTTDSRASSRSEDGVGRHTASRALARGFLERSATGSSYGRPRKVPSTPPGPLSRAGAVEAGRVPARPRRSRRAVQRGVQERLAGQ